METRNRKHHQEGNAKPANYDTSRKIHCRKIPFLLQKNCKICLLKIRKCAVRNMTVKS